MPYLFVGERPSLKAARIGATWQNGSLAGKTLREALQANHINPDAQTYLNLWTQPLPSHCDEDDLAFVLCTIRQKQAQGVTVIALGNLVAQLLYRAGSPHEKIKPPTARGSIRKRERYQAHVGAVLGGVTS